MEDAGGDGDIPRVDFSSQIRFLHIEVTNILEPVPHSVTPLFFIAIEALSVKRTPIRGRLRSARRH